MTAAASKTNFLAWLDGLVTSIVPGRLVFVYEDPSNQVNKLEGHYHHIREEELQDIEQKLMNVLDQWALQCMNAIPPLSLGRYMIITKGKRGWIHFTVKKISVFRL